MSLFWFFKNLSDSSESLPKPVSPKSRHRCPFYGFYYGGIPNIFMDQKGNQCALIMASHSPCQMEVTEQAPNWNMCAFNTKKNRELLENLKESSKVFPEEFFPKNRKEWDGISLGEWMRYVMSDEIERSE